MPTASPIAARKQWIVGVLKPAGTLRIDAGACAALRRGRSLLPAGVVAAVGDFERGDAVNVESAEGETLARGLSAYSAADVLRIMGRRSSEFEPLLGFRGRDEIIHRDDLVLVQCNTAQQAATAATAGDLARVMAQLGHAAAGCRAMLAQSTGAAAQCGAGCRGRADPRRERRRSSPPTRATWRRHARATSAARCWTACS